MPHNASKPLNTSLALSGTFIVALYLNSVLNHVCYVVLLWKDIHVLSVGETMGDHSVLMHGKLL